jgi:hypothetical protein
MSSIGGATVALDRRLEQEGDMLQVWRPRADMTFHLPQLVTLRPRGRFAWAGLVSRPNG